MLMFLTICFTICILSSLLFVTFQYSHIFWILWKSYMVLILDFCHFHIFYFVDSCGNSEPNVLFEKTFDTIGPFF